MGLNSSHSESVRGAIATPSDGVQLDSWEEVLVTGPIEEFETFLSEESPAIHGDRVASTGRAASCRSAIEVARYACVPHLQGRN